MGAETVEESSLEKEFVIYHIYQIYWDHPNSQEGKNTRVHDLEHYKLLLVHNIHHKGPHIVDLYMQLLVDNLDLIDILACSLVVDLSI